MTTLLGIQFNEVNASILVGDRQTTKIDAGGMPNGKHLGRKLWKDVEGNFCLGHAGNMDQETYDLIQRTITGEIDIKKVIEKGYFPELRRMNIKKMGKRVPDKSTLSGLLIATRFDNSPDLYTCFPLGEVGKRGWVSIGSGEDLVSNYIDSLRVLSEAESYLERSYTADVRDVIKTGLEAVRMAQSKDVYSHGLDLVVCLPDRIEDHHAELGDDFGKKLAKIQRKYKPSKNPVTN